MTIVDPILSDRVVVDETGKPVSRTLYTNDGIRKVASEEELVEALEATYGLTHDQAERQARIAFARLDAGDIIGHDYGAVDPREVFPRADG